MGWLDEREMHLNEISAKSDRLSIFKYRPTAVHRCGSSSRIQVASVQSNEIKIKPAEREFICADAVTLILMPNPMIRAASIRVAPLANCGTDSMKPKNCRLISVVTCSPHHSNIKMDFESMPYLESIKYQQCLIIVVNYDRR